MEAIAEQPPALLPTEAVTSTCHTRIPDVKYNASFNIFTFLAIENKKGR